MSSALSRATLSCSIRDFMRAFSRYRYNREKTPTLKNMATRIFAVSPIPSLEMTTGWMERHQRVEKKTKGTLTKQMIP